MENKNNVRNAFSFIWLVFFPFVVSWLLVDKNEYNLSEDDLKFINSYKSLGWLNIVLVLISVFLFIVSAYFNLNILVLIAEFLLFIVFLIIIIHIFFIFSSKFPLFSSNYEINFNFKKVDSGSEYIFYYFPFLSYYLWMEYVFLGKKMDFVRLVKEANLLYFFLFLFAFFVYFFNDFIYIFYLLLIFIILRVLWLIFGVDFRLFNFEKAYSKFPYEVFAYLEGLVYFFVNWLINVVRWKKIASYSKYVNQIKNYYVTWYDIHITLKKLKKYLFLHLSYLIFVLFCIYSFYQAFLGFDNIIVIIFGIVGLFYIFILPVVISKKIFPLPFVSLILYFLLKKF